MRGRDKVLLHIRGHQTRRSVNIWAVQGRSSIEWSPNEEVATEVAVGCIACGNKSDVIKTCGPSTWQDPTYSVSYMGVNRRSGHCSCR